MDITELNMMDVSEVPGTTKETGTEPLQLDTLLHHLSLIQLDYIMIHH
jgi:hypothetical protein